MLATIWPYLATAAGTLTVTWIVQFWMTPRVETRKRRDARWEVDVLALGEFLEFDLADARSSFMSALYGAAALASIQPAPDKASQLEELQKENLNEIREAGSALRRAHSRMEWLLTRVLVLEGFSAEAITLRFTASMAGHKATTALWDALDRDTPAMDSDQCLQLSRELDSEMGPIKKYASAALERRAPVPQSRFQFRIRRWWRLAKRGVSRLLRRRQPGS